MGSVSSNDKSHKEPHEEGKSDKSKFENLIFQGDDLSSRTSRADETQSKRSTVNENDKKLQIELSEYNSNNSNNSSRKKLDRQESVVSNFDKVSIKNQRIQQLNQILNDEIQTYQKEKKEKLLEKQKHHHRKRPRRVRSQIESLILGLWIGVSVSILIVLIVIIQINNLSIANQSNFSRDFPTWRGIAIWIFYVWILGMDVYIYDKFRIKYRQILKLKPDHHPHAINIFRFAGFHSSVFVVLFLLYVLDVTGTYRVPGFAGEYFAMISWGLFLLFLLLPLPVFSNKGRFFVFSLFIDSMLSPFKGVTFPVTWMTDQAVSMAVPLKDLQYTICYYTQLDFQSTYNVCLDSNRISTVMIVAVAVCSIRIVQCIRQGYDKGEYFMTPFFFNTLKYLATLLTAVFAFEYKLGADEIQSAWILFAIISSVYSFVWDLKMDWDLLQRNNLHPLLREKLILGSPKLYYLIIVGNFIMRLAWIITISPKLAAFLGNSNLVFLVTGMIQIFRRGVWNILRVEKEHIILMNTPLKDSRTNSKTLQLQKKLATVQHSLNLQIRMLKFFKKFENNRQNLRSELQRLNEEEIESHNSVVEKYNKKFQEQELQQISSLMQQILKSDSFLKKRLEQDDNLSVFQNKNVSPNKNNYDKQELHQRQNNKIKFEPDQPHDGFKTKVKKSITQKVQNELKKQNFTTFQVPHTKFIYNDQNVKRVEEQGI